ncbi:MAG: hypothetical protein IK093_10550, partial [Ruminiclostridium sp.]|nr:hypothetical protein [Ruminiclostridium sp.]
ILTIRGKETVLPAVFMVCGMMTCFFDFLTCETLTLLMPLLFSIYVRRRRTKTIAKENGGYALKNCILWGIGYVGMWLTKWLLAAFVLGEDVTPYIAGKLTERISDTKGESVFLYMFGGIWRNMTCLFPACLGVIGIMITIVIIIGIVLICIFYHKKGADKGSVILYAALGLIPYIRYIAIYNHSYLHFFFTYRAQAATLLAVCFIVTEIVTFGRSANALKKRKRA